MKFTDNVTIAGTRKRDDGYLVADARVARTGIQIYLGSEVGRPDLATVRVYRPGSEVFSQDTLRSVAHRPVTNDHPDEAVSADNWKEHAVGQTGDEVTGEGIYIRVPLMVSDGETIGLIERGKRELSAGYSCNLDWTGGVTKDGDPYDAVQKNIRFNHVAIVRAGRAGSKIRIGDSADAEPWGASPISTTDQETITMSDALRTVVVDGLSVSTTDQGAQAIAKLQKDLETSAAKIEQLQNDHKAAIDAKDKELADKDAELAKKDAALDAEKAKALSDADLDKRVAARASLVSTAKVLAKDVKTDGVSDADIRKAVVASVRGEAAIQDKSAAYIDAAFEIIAEDASKNNPDAFRDAMKDGVKVSDDATPANDAYAKMVADMQSAHRPATAS